MLLAAVVPFADAQQPAKVPVIGLLDACGFAPLLGGGIDADPATDCNASENSTLTWGTPSCTIRLTMISRYVDEALRRARYDKLDDGTFYAEVPRLRGVLATGDTLEECRKQLAEVVEEWLLIRVAKRLPVPRLGKVAIKVTMAG